ncbi:MAG: hypothetical protein OER04_17235 [Cyclobacteriaceae bacterium]|nr:hypothetical protein [Cyclobacteriaceae bacterium]
MFTSVMRRFSHILLSLMLLVSTVGVTISKHYCGDILLKTAVNKQVETCGDQMDMPEGCCHEETQKLVVDDEYQPVDFQLKSVELPLLYMVTFYELALNSSDEDAIGYTPYYATARTGPKIYLKVQSLLL